MSKTLLIATSNPGKLREIRAVLGDLDLSLKSLADLPDLSTVSENADTFMGNAELKALHFSTLAGLPALADDSGLEVDALDGLPGVKSARFAGADRDDGANNAKLLAMLEGVSPEQRSARFRCAVAVAASGHIVGRAEGTFEGQIVDTPRGNNGFGYDPHFLIPGLGRTAAELQPELKNRLSHRGQALCEIRPVLAALAHRL